MVEILHNLWSSAPSGLGSQRAGHFTELELMAIVSLFNFSESFQGQRINNPKVSQMFKPILGYLISELVSVGHEPSAD